MISILMPIYNGIEFIEESVTSIIQQTYSEWELIIGINGHPANSDVYQIAKDYEKRSDKIHVYDFPELKGKPVTLNEMVKKCKYNWIALLDVDDKWLPMKLEKQIPFMGSYNVIGTGCRYFGDLNISPNIPLGNITGFNFLNFNPIINSSCLINKDVAWWNPEMIQLNDYEMWLRLWKQNKNFFNVPEILVLHRIHNDSAFNAKGNHTKVADLIKKFQNV